MNYSAQDHTFAVCAYKESRYLEECIASLEGQRVRGNIIVSTSTPNDHIKSIAEKHHLPLYVNPQAPDIAGDWGFAYRSAQTPLVTLAHQDDVYEPGYLERMLEKLNGAEKPLICFSDYFEVRDGKKVFSDKSRLLKIKELALLPLRSSLFQKSVWMRRRVLSLCNPICCPAVTYVRDNLPQDIFAIHFKSNVDWESWERISRMKGSFCYVHQPLMGHRIHEESTTTAVIGASNGRSQEDLEMYLKFWPRPIAELLNRLYSGAQKGNAA